MGGCVTPSKPKYPQLNKVQGQTGSTINPTSSAVRFVNNPNTDLNRSIVNPGASQVRPSSIERPLTPGANPSMLIRPTTPPIGASEIRPVVQSILPNGSIASNLQSVQRSTFETPIGINPTIRPMEMHPMGSSSPRLNSILPAQQLVINPTMVPMTQQGQTTVQTVERTSANIPFPVPAGHPQYVPRSIVQNQQITTQSTLIKQDSRPVSPSPVMQTARPITPSQYIQPQQLAPGINQMIDGPNTPPMNRPTIENLNSGFSNVKNSIVTQVRTGEGFESKQVIVPSINTNQPPRQMARPLTPIQPTINFDKRLLNFDKTMFATNTRTPQLNSFTYDLDLPISGETKVKIL